MRVRYLCYYLHICSYNLNKNVTIIVITITETKRSHFVSQKINSTKLTKHKSHKTEKITTRFITFATI